MYVEDITIDGFKSYATRTVVPGFDSQFNAITGLNGSGKSNILDSICFVLGITNLSHVRHLSRVVSAPSCAPASLRSAARHSNGEVQVGPDEADGGNVFTGARGYTRSMRNVPRTVQYQPSACAARAGRGRIRNGVRLGRRRQEADGSAGHLRARGTIRTIGSQCARLHVERHPRVENPTMRSREGSSETYPAPLGFDSHLH